MQNSNRRRMPFYLRDEPTPQYDIRLLRPHTLPLGERFETLEDVDKYSRDSEEKLALSDRREHRRLADSLNECRTSDRNCGSPSCPICARLFRIWFIAELLRIIDSVRTAPVYILTTLLAEAPYNAIDLLNVKTYDATLRKRLSRSGLDDAAVTGGYEIIYRAGPKTWLLHANLLIIGGKVSAIERFQTTFSNSYIARPVVLQPLRDIPRQLSYILKFATYHRPFTQCGSIKSPALPLNPKEHCALVSWMAQWKFQDFMFLFNARREGTKIGSGPWSRSTF
jgi:hypothetical protein